MKRSGDFTHAIIPLKAPQSCPISPARSISSASMRPSRSSAIAVFV